MTITTVIHADGAINAARTANENVGSEFIAGGTTLVDLMQLGITSPTQLVNLTRIPQAQQITINEDGVYLGAGTKMSAVGRHPEIIRRLPVIADAINKAASPQIRNMATVAGNLLQRTRCPRFRDPASACNRREPQSGCERSSSEIRHFAILGASSACQSNYPGDLAVALTTLDATIDILSPTGVART
ncbi:MAG: FAD binding domain-containing protein, partial [Pseudomonadota bacterium]